MWISKKRVKELEDKIDEPKSGQEYIVNLLHRSKLENIKNKNGQQYTTR